MIRPGNYAFDGETQSVVFRSALGSRLREGLGSGTAAFEIDGTDPGERAGWSVIMVGEAEEVTEPAEIDRIEDLELGFRSVLVAAAGCLRAEPWISTGLLYFEKALPTRRSSSAATPPYRGVPHRQKPECDDRQP